MDALAFCPNSNCMWHLSAPGLRWFSLAGYHHTRAFGRVRRFKCHACGTTFSTQTFSIDYYAKRRIDYSQLLTQQCSSESIRALSRSFHVSCGTVLNKIDRLSRQALALHARLRRLVNIHEAVCVDGFVSFEVSQFFPSEVTLSITADSRFILELVHAVHRRCGAMTKSQRIRAAQLYSKAQFERGAITRSFREILNSLERERRPTAWSPLVLITDEKMEYATALRAHALFRNQDEKHRVAHLTVNSKLPRVYANPLFASNYLDREIRKDQAGHHRETTCFNRNASNGMARLACYLVQHNYRKRFLIKAPVGEEQVHAEVAGIPKSSIDRELACMFEDREFLTRNMLPPALEKIWRKAFPTPLKRTKDYLPRFAVA
jgi:hypothetical protein